MSRPCADSAVRARRLLGVWWALALSVAVPCLSLACGPGELDTTSPSAGETAQAVLADAEATGVFGQSGALDTGTYNKGGRSASSLGSPLGVSVAADDSVYIADADNSRVLLFPRGSTVASAVYGQAGSFSDGAENKGGVSADSLRKPQAVAHFPGAGAAAPAGLFVADTLNHRVLFFPDGSTTADRVYGQPDFVSADPGTAADRLSSPAGLAVSSSGELFVADRGNHRVLAFPPGSTVAGTVYGQPNFSSAVSNLGGVSGSSLNGPMGVALDAAGLLYVADTANRRVLRYPSSSQVANAVWGQPNLFSGSPGLGPSSFGFPQAVLIADADLLVSDTANHRVLRFPGGNSVADHVFGQLGDLTSGVANNGGLSARSLRSPVGLAVTSEQALLIADSVNHRVLSYAASCVTVGCDDGNPCTDDVCRVDGTCGHGVASVAPAVCGGFACDPGSLSCRGSCSEASHCAAGHSCIAGRCTRSCADSTVCLGGAGCVDGFCCDVPCAGACQACDVAGSEGTCSIAPVGQDPRLECSGYGCSGAAGCRSSSCTSAADCSAGFSCVGQVCTKQCADASECAGAACVDGACCGSGACEAGASCNFDPAHAGTCTKLNGTDCADSAECGSGFCVDGVCCDAACDGTCKSCKVGGRFGTCSFVPAGQDPNEECPTDAVVCGGFCDGAGACRITAQGTQCRQARCENGLLFEPASCPGAGEACPASQSSPCPDVYGCELDGLSCRTTCTDNAHCAPGAACFAGSCRSAAPSSCTEDSQCPSGFCTDGYCCNSRCEGLCQSCAVPSAEGVCSFVRSGADPDLECSNGAACGLTCDGEGACGGDAAGKQCAPAACAGSSVLLLAATCEATGASCPARAPVDCGAGVCRNAACTDRCNADSDCAESAECDEGVCRFPSADAGCGCQLGAPAPPLSPAWLGVLGWLLLRRRRRASAAQRATA